MRISIALCTYRGERFIREQLESILRQTRPPDELVLTDDASDDATTAVVLGMLDRFRELGVDVTLLTNEQTLGVTANFERCVTHTTGDLIFLCDQDDVWHPDKLAVMAAELQARDDLLLLFTDARLIDARGTARPHTLFDAIELTPRERRSLKRGAAFEVMMRRNVVTGATTAFRRELLTSAVPFGSEWVHDEWLAVIAAATGSVGVIDIATIDYRQHETNQIGARRRSRFELARRLRQPNYVDRFSQLRRAGSLNERIRALDVGRSERELVADRLAFDTARQSYPANRFRRVPAIARQFVAGRYRRFARPRTLVRDLLIPSRWL